MASLSSIRRRTSSQDALAALANSDLNKRCVNCHARSPQFVVLSGFGVFACTRCSGVHTSFGHRVKGVSMSTFTEAETSEIGGNAAFERVWLAGLPKGYTRPHEMGLDDVRRWIEDVYVKKKYYRKEPKVACAGGAGRPAYLDISEEEIAVVPLSDILGASTPILRVESKGAEEARRLAEEEEARKQREDKAASDVDLLGGWDPFGMHDVGDAEVGKEEGQEGDIDDASGAVGGDNAVREAVGESKALSFQDEWATFVEDVKVEEPNDEKLASLANEPGNTAAGTSVEKNATTLEAFCSGVDERKKLQTAASSAARSAPAPRAAVPLDAFFPEFEQIRRTGVLPTGVPDPTRSRRADPGPAQAPTVAANAAPAPAALAAVPTVRPQQQPSRSAPSAAERAGKTLGFGNPFDGGYDLGAAHAPKASSTGNPFG